MTTPPPPGNPYGQQSANPYGTPPANPYGPPPGPNPYAAPAPAPTAPGKQRLRGRIPLRLAAIFGVLGVALIVVGVVVLVHSPLAKINSFPRVDFAAGSSSVQLTRSGNYIAYFETPGTGSHRAYVQMRITDADGTPVQLHPYSVNTQLTYDLDGRHGQALFSFKVASAGTYDVQVHSTDAPPGSDMALGESIAHGLVLGVVTIVPGILLVIAAIVLLIVGLVRRGRHKNELRNGWGGPQPGYAGYQPGPPGPSFTKHDAPPQQQGYQSPSGPGGQGYQQGSYDGGNQQRDGRQGGAQQSDGPAPQ